MGAVEGEVKLHNVGSGSAVGLTNEEGASASGFEFVSDIAIISM